MIRINDLSYIYPDGTQALCNLDWSVEEGACCGIIGPNGAGKSTLVCHLNGFFLPQSGRVSINGTTVEKRTLTEIRRQVGLIFQHPDDQLFMPSISDDVVFGPRNFGMDEEHIHTESERLLRTFDLWELRHKAPFHLSAGQKRFAACASVLIMNPRVLVMDEPTSDLDPRNRRRLIELIRTLTMTRIIVSHDLDFLWDTCDTVCLMAGGRIAAQGAARTILADRTLLQDHLLELPLRLQAD